jgi:hypothetical protein
MVNAKNSHRRVEASVGYRQMLGARAYNGRATSWPLPIFSEGSTARTSRSRGSWAPVPAPTSSTDRASPSVARIIDARRESSLRDAEDVRPISSYFARGSPQ